MERGTRADPVCTGISQTENVSIAPGRRSALIDATPSVHAPGHQRPNVEQLPRDQSLRTDNPDRVGKENPQADSLRGLHEKWQIVERELKSNDLNLKLYPTR